LSIRGFAILTCILNNRAFISFWWEVKLKEKIDANSATKTAQRAGGFGFGEDYKLCSNCQKRGHKINEIWDYCQGQGNEIDQCRTDSFICKKCGQSW